MKDIFSSESKNDRFCSDHGQRECLGPCKLVNCDQSLKPRSLTKDEIRVRIWFHSLQNLQFFFLLFSSSHQIVNNPSRRINRSNPNINKLYFLFAHRRIYCVFKSIFSFFFSSNRNSWESSEEMDASSCHFSSSFINNEQNVNDSKLISV